MLEQEILTFRDQRQVSGCFESPMNVSVRGDFLLGNLQQWLFANTYSEMVQGARQYLASVSARPHKPLFLNNFKNIGAKE
ncbi:hypothetical protein [Pseudomonas sp. N2-5-1-1]|uniref:hypothetical protein n=1 Tax=unclassified Pseudomonas TaxID=196821 RepID=UPI0034E0A859